jgi:adenylosuccinate lyase
MQNNLDRLGGLEHSQRVMLALTQAGMAREDAYQAVQRNAMQAWELAEADRPGAFQRFLKADHGVSTKLDAATLDALFDLDHHTKHASTIFARVFGKA